MINILVLEKTRVFTLGIGSDVSKRLVLGLAKAGKGAVCAGRVFRIYFVQT